MPALVVTAAALLLSIGSSAAAVSASPDVVGAWSAPVAWPLVAVHMSLEPTGEVFALDGFDAAVDSERLWDPTTGTFTAVPYSRNLFCSGHIQLADGRTLIVGGHVTANAGLADTTIFNPQTKTYFRGPDMSVGRWYPTATELPDGRVLAFSGDNIVQDRPGADPPFSDASVDSLPSVFDPKTNAWTDLPGARLTSPLYPYMFVLSDGRVFDAGPDKTTRILDPSTWTWSTVGTSPIDGHSAVMYRPNKIMKSGTWADPDFNGASAYNADGRTAVIDMSAPTPSWRSTAPMAFGRSYHNLTLLPDGTVLASGGMSGSDGTDLTKAVLPAEIWNPDTETWTTVASLTNGREYHSTALLLPDGRVLMAGGGALPGRATDQKNAEIYSPPYLFKGPRPTITSLPLTVTYGSSFDVSTPNAAGIAKVSLIRSPSVTHAFDQNQRFQFLNFTAAAGKVTVQAPANANLAPPGDYMLFLVDTNGVPSVGAFLRVSAPVDSTPPTAPSNLTATGSPGQATLSWTAATDAVGVTRYNVHRGTTTGFTPSAANRIAQPVGTTYVDSGLAAGTYYYKVTAEDAAGNVSVASNEASAAVAGAPPAGLVAAYSFDEGSGATLTDLSGKGNNGTISGATWTGASGGKFGSALSFDGVNDWVTAADSATLDLTSGMTLEAWVNPAALGTSWRTAVFKETSNNYAYALYGNTGTTRPSGNVLAAGVDHDQRGTAALALNAWTHLAATYDGSNLRLFVNGAQVGSQAATGSITVSTGALRIGGNNIWPEWFQGLIDDVRVYNRALTQAEIQTDMTTSIGTPDTQAPTAPSGLGATGNVSSASLSWTASSDNVGVSRYNVHRSTTAGFTPSASNRIAQPTGTSFVDSGLAAGTYYYRVTAEDAAGNVSAASNEASVTISGDVTAPSAPASLVASPGPGTASLSWTASSDNVGVSRYNVHRSTTSGFTPSAGNRIAQPTGTSYADSGLAAGTYYYKVTAEDASGNVSGASNEASAVVTTAPPNGVVAAYSFDEGSGATLTDLSGKGNNGTISGATWTGASGGKFGSALSFDGVNDWVTVADSATLDLTSGMTLEAWVNPGALGNAWRTVIMKEQAGEMVYDLYANGSGGTKVPATEVFVAGSPKQAKAASALTVNTWTHLAATYDGAGLKIYVNGTQAGSLAQAGSITTSTGALRVGGNNIWPEWFQGLIDEVRIYNRALSQAEIQTDMATRVGTPDTQAPTVPTGFTKTASTTTTIATSWNGSTDNVGVTGYNLYRNGLQVSTTTATQHTFTGLTCGTAYDLAVEARDAANNVSGQTTLTASTDVCDTTAPSAPGSLAATGSLSSASLTWTASTDNVGVVRYNVHRSTTAGFTPSAANRIGQPTGTSYTDTGLAANTYYYKVTAEDASGNVSAASNEASATVTGDVTAPTAPGSLSATGGPSQAALSWTASTDDVGVARYNVHRSTTSGFTPTTANRIAQPTGTSYTDSGLAAGTYYYKVTAEDAAGNVSGASNQASATVTAVAPAGLVAAYSFDEGSGTSVGDLSGKGNAGTISGATWTTSGKFASALSFDGVNDWVTVADSNTLDLTTAMTLEAWVFPTALGTSWRTAVFKEQTGNYAYGLYANTGTTRPSVNVIAGGVDEDLRGSAALTLNAWTHLAATYDGSNLRLYANGTQVASKAASGAITNSTGALRIGGNNIWPEWFQGRLDEIRVYNRALTQAEIQTDMNTSVGTPDTQAPTAPASLAATGAVGTATLTWTASTDDVGVVRYNVHRSTTAGFTPTTANRVAQPTATSYTDAGLAAGTYYYKVTAEDLAGNISPASNEANATVASDTVAPSVPGNLQATAAPGQAALSWTASTDNVAVARYNVHRSTAAGFTPSAGNRIAQPTGTSYSDTSLAAGTYHYRVTAEDASGNVSGPSNEASATITAAPPVGLVAAYGFDEAAGTSAADASGSGNGGTVSGAGWTIGKFGTALSFDGVNDWVTAADSSSLDLTNGMTLEAWLFPTALGSGWRTAIFKEQTGNYAYGLYANTGTSRPSANVVSGGVDHDLRGTAQLSLNTWSHLAATYDGANLRLYVNGSQVASQPATGNITTSTGALRVGGNNIWPEWFQGRIDELRVYNRALSEAQIQADMATGTAPDIRDPSVAAVSPASGAANITIDSSVQATFSEAMSATSITTSTFELSDGAGNPVPATVSYDPLTAQATLTPTSALLYATTYTARVRGGSTGVKDLAGRSMATDRVWTFTMQPSPPPIAVLTSTANPYTSYVGEILRAEGFSFATLNTSLMSPAVLGYYDAVVLGEMPLNAAQVTMLSNWVTAGGNLIAMRPDKQLAGLLGLTDAGTTLGNAYLRIDTATEPGAGIVGGTIQYHGTADRYTLNGASSIATLYSNASTATPSPAVTLRSIGASGGQAAAFAYDLARSVILTRQGNPAWAGQERDGILPIRPDDLFFGARTGDVQPDWVDLTKVAIPQADEQQRLLANLLTTMTRDRKPVPHFWYLPRGEKAAVVMTGDDHAQGGTAGRFDRYKVLSPAGCSVASWDCVRSTSYIYPNSPLTNAQAAGYVTEGFEVALHVNTGGGPCANWTPTSLESNYTDQLASFAAKYTSVPAPVTERTHCVAWSDWATQPKVELGHGIRLDTNYYYYPDTWIATKPGFMTGSGLIMRFADTDGSLIDVYQANTEMTDEGGQAYPATVDALLDRAVGPDGYYGVFVANMHTDLVASAGSEAIVSSALARSVPVVSAKQMLDWVDGRNGSSFSEFSWSAGTLGFRITVGAGASGLQAMLPTQSGSGTLTTLTRGGSPVVYTVQSVKGIEYAVFTAGAGTYSATYSG